MSRLTLDEAQVEEYGETYLIDRNGFEYPYNWQTAYCKKCWNEVNDPVNSTRCESCKAFIT